MAQSTLYGAATMARDPERFSGAGTQGSSAPLPIHLRDPIRDQAWAELLSTHPAASIFHTPGWLSALRRTYDYEPLVATTCPSNAKLTNGVVFCLVRSIFTGRRLVALPFSDHCEVLAGSAAEVDELLRSLPQLLDTFGCKSLELRPLRTQPAARTGFVPSGAYFMHELHLADSPAEAFRRLHKDSIQRKVRRAEREGLRYEEGRSEKLIDEFYRLLLLTRRRQHLPPQPLSWFRNLADCMGESLKVRAAYKNGEAVASIITLQFKHSLAYKYGTSDLVHQNLGGVHMLLWRSIQQAIEQGLKVFDLGRTDMDNDGLATFKE